MAAIALTPEARANSSTIGLEPEIRLRAYELYQQRGCTPGHEDEDWLIAEREVLARCNHRQRA
jgi:hypothetical protein